MFTVEKEASLLMLSTFCDTVDEFDYFFRGSVPWCSLY